MPGVGHPAQVGGGQIAGDNQALGRSQAWAQAPRRVDLPKPAGAHTSVNLPCRPASKRCINRWRATLRGSDGGANSLVASNGVVMLNCTGRQGRLYPQTPGRMACCLCQFLCAIQPQAALRKPRERSLGDWCSQVRSVPFKKAAKTVIGYLDKPEVQALLQAPNRSSILGARDHALLLFLYNSGARAAEAASLRVSHLQLGTSPSVRILGKGNKWRVCPLWTITVAALRPLVAGNGADDQVFHGRTGEPMTRFGVHRMVTTHAITAAKQVESMQGRRISPHTLRHTTAVHLLRSGVDINTIRAWLGHVSLDTTHIYAEVDLDMKAKALACVDITDLPTAARARSPAKSATIVTTHASFE